MALAGREIAVIGAGIGGLAAATALAQRRARVTVFERAPALGEVGAGLQVAPNGVAVLEALGMRDAAEARAGDDLFAEQYGEQSIGKVVLAAPLPDGGWECLAVLQTASADSGSVHFGTPDGPIVDVLPLPYSLG